jgi:hypothetical protein
MIGETIFIGFMIFLAWLTTEASIKYEQLIGKYEGK